MLDSTYSTSVASKIVHLCLAGSFISGCNMDPATSGLRLKIVILGLVWGLGLRLKIVIRALCRVSDCASERHIHRAYAQATTWASARAIPVLMCSNGFVTLTRVTATPVR